MNFFEPSTPRIPESTTRISNPRVAGSSPAAPTNQSNSLEDQIVAGTKKPQHSDYVSRQVRILLDRAAGETHEKRRFALLERARDLSRILRRSDGLSPWIPVGFALGACAFLAWLAVSHRPTGYTFAAPKTYVRVLERIDPYAFRLQRTDSGVPQVPMIYHFCRDYQPLFEPGMTLSWFSYDDRGNCISIAPADRGYVIVRGPDYRPVLTKF